MDQQQNPEEKKVCLKFERRDMLRQLFRMALKEFDIAQDTFLANIKAHFENEYPAPHFTEQERAVYSALFKERIVDNNIDWETFSLGASILGLDIHLNLQLKPRTEEPKEDQTRDLHQKLNTKIQHVFTASLGEIRNGRYILGCLERNAGITYLGELVQMKPQDVMRVVGIGEASYNTIRCIIEELGMSFEMDVKGWKAPVKLKEILVPISITVAELAKLMNIKASVVMRQLTKYNQHVTMNQALDQETATWVVNSLGLKAVSEKVIHDRCVNC